MDDFDRLNLSLGMVHGLLAADETRERMVRALQTNTVLAGHIVLLRDKLTALLRASACEPEPDPPASCAECGKASTHDSMWALYCVDCIQTKAGPALRGS